jgi:hypothetical protein
MRGEEGLELYPRLGGEILADSLLKELCPKNITRLQADGQGDCLGSCRRFCLGGGLGCRFSGRGRGLPAANIVPATETPASRKKPRRESLSFIGLSSIGSSS